MKFQRSVVTRAAALGVAGCALLLHLSGVSANQAGKQTAKNPIKDAINDPAPSITRADLLACSQIAKAKAKAQRNLDVGAFTDLLNGTWVRELTWYAAPGQTEPSMYFDFRRSHTALMFDQSNLGKGPLSARLEAIKRSPETLSRTPTLTFVDCDYSMVDRYYKISDDFVFEGIPVRPNDSQPLESAWSQLQSAGIFDRPAEPGRQGAETLSGCVGGGYW